MTESMKKSSPSGMNTCPALPARVATALPPSQFRGSSEKSNVGCRTTIREVVTAVSQAHRRGSVWPRLHRGGVPTMVLDAASIRGEDLDGDVRGRDPW